MTQKNRQAVIVATLVLAVFIFTVSLISRPVQPPPKMAIVIFTIEIQSNVYWAGRLDPIDDIWSHGIKGTGNATLHITAPGLTVWIRHGNQDGYLKVSILIAGDVVAEKETSVLNEIIRLSA